MKLLGRKRKRRKESIRNAECIADPFSEDSSYTPELGVGGVEKSGGGKRRKAFL